MPYLKYFVPVIIFSLASCSGCHNSNIQATTSGKIPSVAPFSISSPAFKNGDFIPTVYTCDSANISPPLSWSNPFKNTASYALIADDPDAPLIPWIHWIIYNIPAADTNLPAQLPKDSELANGIKQGFTSFRSVGYGGPCPPEGMHHYYFKLFALDTAFHLRAGLTKAQLLKTMKGHILAEADLMGKYTRKKNK